MSEDKHGSIFMTPLMTNIDFDLLLWYWHIISPLDCPHHGWMCWNLLCWDPHHQQVPPLIAWLELKLWTLDKLSSSIFCCLSVSQSVCQALVTPSQISTFSIYTDIKALHYKPVPPSPDPVPSSINKYFFLFQIFSSFFSNFNCLTFLCQPEMSTVVR